MSTVVEMKSQTDTFATMWAVKMLNCLGLSDIILQCDPGTISHQVGRKWIKSRRRETNSHPEVLPDGDIRATEESKTIRNRCKDKCVQC